MEIQGWSYYNHAAIQTTAPHENPDTSPVEDGSIWEISGGTPLLVRWTTDFDCSRETNWWYVIKDNPFDASGLKAKRRYEINKGIKNFEVVKINPTEYKEDLYDVQVAAFSAYPKKYRPVVDKESFFADIDKWEQYVVFGAFFRESNKLCGYALLSQTNEKCVNFNVLKTKPDYERNGVNAALVEGILKNFNEFLTNGGYICDGGRSINHETAFQDYLEKYFGFRKAYCRLHIVYNSKIKWIIKSLFPFRKFLLKFDGIGKIHQINSVMRMEEIARE